MFNAQHPVRCWILNEAKHSIILRRDIKPPIIHSLQKKPTAEDRMWWNVIDFDGLQWEYDEILSVRVNIVLLILNQKFRGFICIHLTLGSVHLRSLNSRRYFALCFVPLKRRHIWNISKYDAVLHSRKLHNLFHITCILTSHHQLLRRTS